MDKKLIKISMHYKLSNILSFFIKLATISKHYHETSMIKIIINYTMQ